MSKDNTSENAPSSGHDVARQIFRSLLVVGLCWVGLRFGSLIVSVAISHTWDPNDPVFVAYAFCFRQLIMTFLYPSVLSLFRPAFIPLYNQIKKEEGEEAATTFACGVLEIGMLVGVLIFATIWLVPDLTVTVMAPKFSAEEHATVVRMMRLMAPGILCLLFAEMYLIVFHARKHFAYPHGAEAVQKIGWGLGIVAGILMIHQRAASAGSAPSSWDEMAIGVTYSLACAAQLLINIVGMRRTFGWALRKTAIGMWMRTWGKRAGLLVLPLVVGILGARFRDLITHRFQSDLSAVAYNSVELARQLTNLPMVFLGQIVSIVMLPHLASVLHSQGKDTHRKTIEMTIETLCLIALPIVAVTLVMAPELMSLVFIPNQWEPSHTVFCADGALAMRMMALGFLFLMLENILLPGLFSVQSMWWPTMWGLLASAFQVLCLVGLATSGLSHKPQLLLAGVAVVFPLSRIFKNGVLLLVLRKKTSIFPGGTFVALLAKTAGLFVVAFVCTFVVHKVLGIVAGGIPVGKSMTAYKLILVVQLAVPAGVMFGVYGVVAWMIGYKKHALDVVGMVRNRKKGKAKTETVEAE